MDHGGPAPCSQHVEVVDAARDGARLALLHPSELFLVLCRSPGLLLRFGVLASLRVAPGLSVPGSHTGHNFQVDASGEEAAVVASVPHRPVVNPEDVISLREVLQRVRDEYDSLAGERPLHAVQEHGLPHLRIQRCHGVVQEIHVRVGVHRASDGDAVLLAATEVHPLLPDLRVVPPGEHEEVGPELGDSQGIVVPLGVERRVEEDVLPEARVLDPGGLGGVRHPAPDTHLPLFHSGQLHDGVQKCRFSAADFAEHDGELPLGDLKVHVGENLLEEERAFGLLSG